MMSTKTKYGFNYQINPMSDFYLTNQFGFECVDEGLNLLQKPTHNPNPPLGNTSNRYRSQEEVKSIKGLPLSFNREKKQK